MEHQKFSASNVKLLAPDGMENCDTLHALKDEEGFTSYWKPNAEERLAILNGACITLKVFGRAHPPVYIGVEYRADIQG